MGPGLVAPPPRAGKAGAGQYRPQICHPTVCRSHPVVGAFEIYVELCLPARGTTRREQEKPAIFAEDSDPLLSSLRRVQHLSLHSEAYQGDDLDYFKLNIARYCTHLQVLEVADHFSDEAAVAVFRNCVHLRSYTDHYTSITDDVLEALAESQPPLECFDSAGGHWEVTSADLVQRCAKVFATLQTLVLQRGFHEQSEYYCDNQTALSEVQVQTFATAVRHMGAMQKIVTGAVIMHPSVLGAMAGTFTQLRVFDVLAKWLPEVVHQESEECNGYHTVLAQRNPFLEVFRVMHAVSSDVVAALGGHCRRLRELRCGLGDASEAALLAVAKGCPLLEELELQSCTQFTDRALAAVSTLSHLKGLNVGQSRGLTDAGIVKLFGPDEDWAARHPDQHVWPSRGFRSLFRLVLPEHRFSRKTLGELSDYVSVDFSYDHKSERKAVSVGMNH